MPSYLLPRFQIQYVPRTYSALLQRRVLRRTWVAVPPWKRPKIEGDKKYTQLIDWESRLILRRWLDGLVPLLIAALGLGRGRYPPDSPGSPTPDGQPATRTWPQTAQDCRQCVLRVSRAPFPVWAGATGRTPFLD